MVQRRITDLKQHLQKYHGLSSSPSRKRKSSPNNDNSLIGFKRFLMDADSIEPNRLSKIGCTLSRKTPADGNCFIHAMKDQCG